MQPNSSKSTSDKVGAVHGVKLLIEHVWIDQFVMIRVSGDFKALMTTAFDAVFLFDASDHV